MRASEVWGWATGAGRRRTKRPRRASLRESAVFAQRRGARLGATLKIIVVLGLAILGAGGYALFAGRLGRPAGNATQSAPEAPAADVRGRDRQGKAVSSPAAVAGDAREASPVKHEPELVKPSLPSRSVTTRRADQPAAPAPPGDDQPKLPSAAGDRERVRSTPPKVPAPVAAGRARSQDPPPRERAAVPAPEPATDANDPTAIIDWLMKERR